jgi:adenylate kinase
MANLILLGAPGSGKGSQAVRIIKKLNIPQISTGDMLRDARKKQTDMGKMAGEFMDRGDLVPDQVVIGIVKDRLNEDDCKNGFILDGFPRTIPQAKSLDVVLENINIKLDYVIEIDVPEEIIIPRITGRRSCPDCKRPFHTVFLKPLVENRCDDCKVDLVQRLDDTVDAVKVRLEAYHEKTEPLANFYKNKGLLKIVDGEGEMDEVTQRIFEFLS